jgi:hypothetical protein
VSLAVLTVKVAEKAGIANNTVKNNTITPAKDRGEIKDSALRTRLADLRIDDSVSVLIFIPDSFAVYRLSLSPGRIYALKRDAEI